MAKRRNRIATASVASSSDDPVTYPVLQQTVREQMASDVFTLTRAIREKLQTLEEKVNRMRY